MSIIYADEIIVLTS